MHRIRDPPIFHKRRIITDNDKIDEIIEKIRTVFQLVLDSGFEIEGFYKCCLVEGQGVTNASDVYAFSGHTNTQLCR